LKRTAQIKSGDQIIGSRIKAKIVKNKVAPPFKTTEFDIYYNQGISYLADLINLAIKEEVIKKSGSWLQYNNIKLGQGIEGAKKYLKTNEELVRKVKEEILSNLKAKNAKLKTKA
jgi:recombination protein RecA